MPTSDMEPVLVIVPSLVGPCFNELRDAGMVARHWHPEGRYGSRINALADEENRPKGWRALPLLQSTADRILKYTTTGAISAAEEIPALVIQALETGEAELRRLPVTQPRLPKVSHFPDFISSL